MDDCLMKATKGQVWTRAGTTYNVARLILPPWMEKGYRGEGGTRRQRKRIRRLTQRLYGFPVNEDSDSDTETTPSPPTSQDEAEDDTEEGSDYEPDSEPDTDEILGEPSSRRNSSTRDDILDRKEPDPETDDDDPELEDLRKLRSMLREMANQRDNAHGQADTDPEHEGPGPVAPTSPM